MKKIIIIGGVIGIFIIGVVGLWLLAGVSGEVFLVSNGLPHPAPGARIEIT